MYYLEQLYLQPAFIAKAGKVKPSPIAYNDDLEPQWSESEAHEDHLHDLAQEFGLTNFYVIHYDLVHSNPSQFAFIDGIYEEVLERASHGLLQCVDNQDAFVNWVVKYNREFEEEVKETRRRCTANSVLLKRLIEDREKEEYMLGTENLAPLAKLERILQDMREKHEFQKRKLINCFVDGNRARRLDRLKQWFCVKYFPQAPKFLEDEIREKFRRECVVPDRPGALHFALHIKLNEKTHHWVLVSVVKDKGSPVMLMQDSINETLDSLPGAPELINFVHDKFVKLFMQE